jgi:hypothetical protein
LLKDITIKRKKPVLAVEITYFPMQIGFMYVAVIMDQTPRHVEASDIKKCMSMDYVA